MEPAHNAPANDPAPGLDTSPAPRGQVGQAVLLLAVAVGVAGVSAGSAWLLRSRLRQPAGESPLLSSPATGVEGEGGRVARGRLVFQVYCASCHGSEGHGDGPSAAQLHPPPRDLATGPWKYGTSPQAVRRVIAEGIPGTAMPALGPAVSSQDVDALVAFVLSLASPGEGPDHLSASTRALLQRAGFTPAGTLRPAPPFEVCDTNGTRRTLAQLRGKLVLLNFWGTTCAPCLAELPELERLEAEFQDRGLVVLCVCADEQDVEAVRKIAASHLRHMPACVDETGLARVRYDAQVMPTTFLIDQEGRLLGSVSGAPDWSAAGVKELLRNCLTTPLGE